MNTGKQTIEWLYGKQLKVDAEWSIRISNGFKWWADKNAQTIEVISEEKGPNGLIGHLISIRTEFLRNLNLNERSLKGINALLMPFSSMAGPVYEASTRTLSLCSLVRVYEAISPWMNPLISVAAFLQIAEARIMGSVAAEALGAQESIGGHPQNGIRPQPEELAEIVASLIGPMGQGPCRWPESEFQDTCDQYMRQPPSLLGTAGSLGFTVEFPYAEMSSLCQVKGNQPYPWYGNGLFLLQSFPIFGFSDSEGIKLALSLNTSELTEKPSIYGFGSYAYRRNIIHSTSFFPNAAYRPGLLPNIYFSCAGRAKEMALRLMGREWTEQSFDPRRSAMGRWLDCFEEQQVSPEE